MYCAPGIRKNGNGCLDRPALVKIAEAINRKHGKKIINYSGQTSDDQLWNQIRDSFANVCGSQEWCWLDQNTLKSDDLKMLNQYYKPPGPETKTKWLSTSDINHVLRQFERIYPDFAFMGTVPINFDQVIEAYGKLNLCMLQKGDGIKMDDGRHIYKDQVINKVGFVFNLDPSYKSGSHWVSMFLNLAVPKPYIGYFDSYGQCPPPQEIMKLMQRIQEQGRKCLGVNITIKCNTIQHQYKGTECGTYSLYFIYSSLQGKSFEEIVENIILDDDMNLYRDFFFRPHVSKE